MTNPNEHVPVMQCVVSAFVFLKRNLAWIYKIGGVYLFTSIASTWLIVFYPQMPALNGLGAMLSLALIPLVVMLFAAYLRKGLGINSSGFMGLQFGTDELRLFLTMFAIGAITAFIIFLGAMAGVFALSAVVATVVDPAILEAEPTSAFANAGATGFIAAVLAGLGVAALGLYTLARFSPAYPAVIAEGRVVIFEAANWSKGQGWRMALAMALISTPFLLLLAPGMFQYVRFFWENMPAPGTGAVTISQPDLKPLLWFYVLSAILWPAANGIRSGLYVTFYRGLRASKKDI